MIPSKRCPLCNGAFVEGTTSFTVDYKQGLIVVRNVPAMICNQCGEAWLSNETSAQLERLVLDAKREARQFEVIDMAA